MHSLKNMTEIGTFHPIKDLKVREVLLFEDLSRFTTDMAGEMLAFELYKQMRSSLGAMDCADVAEFLYDGPARPVDEDGEPLEYKKWTKAVKNQYMMDAMMAKVIRSGHQRLVNMANKGNDSIDIDDMEQVRVSGILILDRHLRLDSIDDDIYATDGTYKKAMMVLHWLWDSKGLEFEEFCEKVLPDDSVNWVHEAANAWNDRQPEDEEDEEFQEPDFLETPLSERDDSQ